MTSCAPNAWASLRRSGATSMAMTRAPMTTANCVTDKPTGPWPKMASVSPPCRLIRFSRAGTAGDRRAGDEGERVRQRYQCRHRHLHVFRVAAVAARAEDHRAREAHLRPPRPAMLAGAAAVVVVVHHALADPGLPLGDPGAHRCDDAAGLVAGDHAGLPLDAAGHGPGRLGRGAIVVQVATAHARRLDLEDHVSGTGCRIGELSELELSISEKDDAFHGFLRCAILVRPRDFVHPLVRRSDSSTTVACRKLLDTTPIPADRPAHRRATRACGRT